MRGLLSKLVGGVLSFSATAILILPVLFLLAWSLAYLRSTWQVLTAPGVPVRFSYKARGGMVTLSADSYVARVRGGQIILRQVRAIGPNSERFLSANQVTVGYPNQRLAINGRQVEALITRKPGGGFSIEDYLLPPTEEESKLPYKIILRDIRLTYQDATQAPTLSSVLAASQISAEGIGDSFILQADADVSRVGRFPLSVQVLKSNMFIRARMQGAELAPGLDHIRRWLSPSIMKQLGPIEAKSLVVTGPIELNIFKKRDPLLMADISAHGEGLRFGTYMRQATVELTAKVRGTSGEGSLRVNESGRSLAFEGGAALFSSGMRVAGQTSVSLSNRGAAWPELQALFPDALSFQRARYVGGLAFADQGFRLSGELAADGISAFDNTIAFTKWKINISPTSFAARSLQGMWLGGQMSAAFRIGFSDRQVSGYINVPQGKLDQVARHFGLPVMGGNALFDGLLSGTLQKPKFALSARGRDASVTVRDELLDLGSFEMRANFEGKGVNVPLLAISGPSGAYVARGDIDLQRGELNAFFNGGGVDLGAFIPDTDGRAFFSGEIGGRFDRPTVRADAEVYGFELQGRKVPLITGRFEIDSRSVKATSIEAESGTSVLRGELAWDFTSDVLSGKIAADNLQMADWTNGQAAGLLSLRNGVVGGTLASPSVSGRLESTEMTVSGLAIASGQADFEFEDGVLRASGAHLNIGEGVLEGDAHYSFVTKAGRVEAVLDRVPLGQINLRGAGVTLDGSASGSLSASVNPNGLESLGADLRLADVQANGSLVGTGQAKVSAEDGLWSGHMEIGYSDRFLIVDQLSYDILTGRLMGRADLLNLSLQDVSKATLAAMPQVSEGTRSELGKFDGQISAGISFEGPREDLALAMQDATISGLKYEGRDAGNLSISATHAKSAWQIDSLRWARRDSVILARGSVTDQGQVDVSADSNNLDLNWLATFLPDLPSVPVRSSFAFEATGPYDALSVRGSLGAAYVDPNLASGAVQPVRSVQLTDVQIQKGQFNADGVFFADGFTGTISGNGPLRALWSDEQEISEPLTARLELRPRDVLELKTLLPWLDESRSEGTIRGSLSFTGTPSRYLLDGAFDLRASSMAARTVDTSLNNVQANISVTGDGLTFAASAESSRGGAISTNGTIDLVNIADTDQTLEGFLARSTVEGEIRAKGFSIMEVPESADYRLAGTIDEAALKLLGSLARPSISGSVSLSGLDGTIPPELPVGRPSEELLINPQFRDISLSTVDPARLRTASADMSLNAAGVLGGSLAYPQMTARMEVLSGVFRLPTARVSLEEGGIMNFRFVSGPGLLPDSRLDLNLEGRTSVTARKTSEVPERYDVALRITGNLLESGGLNLAASSDPPDLTQSEILALLGQKEFIEQLALQRTGESQIRGALFTFGLPTFTAPITEEIATSLSLDFFTIEYNPFEQATLAAGKTLAKGLTITGRRQISDPIIGQPYWDLKLSYRLPSRNRILSRTRLSVGTDRDRPWKIGVDYSLRF